VATEGNYIRYECTVYVYMDSFVTPVAIFTKSTRLLIPAVYTYIEKLQILWKSAHNIEILGSFVGRKETF